MISAGEEMCSSEDSVSFISFFNEEEVKEELVKVNKFQGQVVKTGESPFKIDIKEVRPEEELAILDAPAVPELPDFPEVEEESDNFSLEDSIFEEDDEERPEKQGLSQNNQAGKPATSQNNINPTNNLQDFNAAPGEITPRQEKKIISDPRYAPIIVVKGAPGNNISGVGSENNLKILGEDQVVNVEDSLLSIFPTKIKNRENVVAQGKIITGVLETAVDTELEGVARAIVSRDVYGEVGNKVLMPKGSRLYGSYQASNQRGAARVEIIWNRLIRPDGISIAINSNVSDQFGRAGIEGNIDNKVQETIANSFLSSVLAIAGVAATDALTGGSNSTTTTDPSTGTSTVTQTAINQAVSDIASNITSSAQTAVSGLFNTRPRITIPQGTRINIIVNSDIKVPTFEK